MQICINSLSKSSAIVFYFLSANESSDNGFIFNALTNVDTIYLSAHSFQPGCTQHPSQLLVTQLLCGTPVSASFPKPHSELPTHSPGTGGKYFASHEVTPNTICCHTTKV